MLRRILMCLGVACFAALPVVAQSYQTSFSDVRFDRAKGPGMNVGKGGSFMRIPVAIRLVMLAGMLAAPCSLHGQAPLGWIQLSTEQGMVTGVGAKILRITGGYQVFFKNFGTSPVRSGFYLNGVQTADATPGNGRVHLKPRNSVGLIEIAIPPGGLCRQNSRRRMCP